MGHRRIRVSQKVNDASRVRRIGMLNNVFRSNLTPFNATLIIFGWSSMECNNVDPFFDETLSPICNYRKRKAPFMGQFLPLTVQGGIHFYLLPQC